MGEFQSFVSLDIWTMIFSWGNLIVLFLFLKKILFKPLQNIIETRQKQIDDMYASAQNDKDSAAAMRDEYEEKLSKASLEGEEIIKNAVGRARRQEELILREANETAQKTLLRAEEKIDLERKKARNQLKDEVSVMAVDIASAVIEKNLSETDNKEIIDRFISSLGEETKA